MNGEKLEHGEQHLRTYNRWSEALGGAARVQSLWWQPWD